MISLLVTLALASTSPAVTRSMDDVPLCGAGYHEPFGPPGEVPQRHCHDGPRSYRSKYHTLGHEILDLESAQCANSDESYKLLDELIGEAKLRIQYDPRLEGVAREAQARRISAQIGNLLEEKNFFFENWRKNAE